MDESWTGVLSLIGGAILGYVTHYLQARTPTKDNDRVLEDNAIGRDATRRTEALEHFRSALAPELRRWETRGTQEFWSEEEKP